MIDIEILDVAIGLAFVYLILSLAVTAANEMLAAWFKRRAWMLHNGVANLLRDPWRPVRPSVGAKPPAAAWRRLEACTASQAALRSRSLLPAVENLRASLDRLFGRASKEYRTSNQACTRSFNRFTGTTAGPNGCGNSCAGPVD